MSLNQWLNMWARLTYGSAGLSDFPIWVQLLPNIFFRVIDQDSEWDFNFSFKYITEAFTIWEIGCLDSKYF